MIRVAFIDFVFEDRVKIRLDGCEFSIHGPLRTADDIVSAAAGADVLCMRDQFSKVTGDVFERLPGLKLLVTRSAGYEHIDLEAAARHSVPVCNVPDYGAHMIAEHAFGLLLAVARNIVNGHQRTINERYFSDRDLSGVELHGKTLGVVGAGRIGKHAIRIGQGFGMRVIAHDLAPDEASAKELGFTYTSLEQLLANSDAITLHVNLNEDTHHLIDEASLAMVKPEAILVNTSRGGVVDTDALIAVLRSGHLAGAGLDVIEGEPAVQYDFSDLNVVITPHLGWYTSGAVDRIMEISLNNIAAFMRGELLNQVGV